MKKNIIFLFLLAFLLIFSACADVSLSYTLSSENTTDQVYRLVFEEPEQDVSSYLNEFGSYWADQGMAIYVDKDTNTVTGEKSQEFDWAKDAADSFAGIFTSQDSIFSNVTFHYSPELSSDTYSFLADVSLKDIIRQNEAQGISADQINILENDARQGHYSISISLPGDVVETNADSQSGNLCTWTLAFGETKTLELKTQKENAESVRNYNMLSGIIENNKTIIFVCAAAAVFCVLMIVLSIIVRKIKKKRASEIRIKHFR